MAGDTSDKRYFRIRNVNFKLSKRKSFKLRRFWPVKNVAWDLQSNTASLVRICNGCPWINEGSLLPNVVFWIRSEQIPLSFGNRCIIDKGQVVWPANRNLDFPDFWDFGGRENFSWVVIGGVGLLPFLWIMKRWRLLVGKVGWLSFFCSHERKTSWLIFRLVDRKSKCFMETEGTSELSSFIDCLSATSSLGFTLNCFGEMDPWWRQLLIEFNLLEGEQPSINSSFSSQGIPADSTREFNS